MEQDKLWQNFIQIFRATVIIFIASVFAAFGLYENNPSLAIIVIVVGGLILSLISMLNVGYYSYKLSSNLILALTKSLVGLTVNSGIGFVFCYFAVKIDYLRKNNLKVPIYMKIALIIGFFMSLSFLYSFYKIVSPF